MNSVAHHFPDYKKYFRGSSQPIKAMGNKKKGKVLVHFLKDAMKLDWKNSGDIKSVIDRSIETLQKKKDQDKLANGAKRKFKELKGQFQRDLQAEAAKSAPKPEPKKEETFEQAARRIESVIEQRIKSTPLAFQLYKEACAVQHAQFNRVKNIYPMAQFCVVSKMSNDYGMESQPDGSCSACCDWYKGRIIIEKRDDENDMVSSALFELCNMKRQVQFAEVEERARKGLIRTADEYAFESERVEYGSVLEHRAIMSKIIAQSGWETSMNKFEHVPNTFEERWSSIKNSYHADYFRKAFDKVKKA